MSRGLKRTKQGERKEVEGQMEKEVASGYVPCCLGLCADWKLSWGHPILYPPLVLW